MRNVRLGYAWSPARAVPPTTFAQPRGALAAAAAAWEWPDGLDVVHISPADGGFEAVANAGDGSARWLVPAAKGPMQAADAGQDASD